MSDSLNVLCEAVCPKCHSAIPLEDINAGQDIALCRKCSHKFSFAKAVREEEIGAVDLDHPPKGVWYQRTPNGFELGCSTRSAAVFFLFPFMLLWSGGSLGGIYGSQIAKGHFNLPMSLFGLPFLFGTICLGSITLMTICGKFCVRAEGSEGEVFVGVGSLGYRKKFQWQDVKDIRVETRYSSKGTEYKRILIDAGTPVRIPNVPGSRLNFFLAALRQLRHEFFAAAPRSAVPPRISEVA